MESVDKEWLITYLKGMYVIILDNKHDILKLQPGMSGYDKRIIREGILSFLKIMIEDVEGDFIKFAFLTQKIFNLKKDGD